MRTDTKPVAIHWSGIVHIFVILWLTCAVDTVHGQHVHVEWLRYEDDGTRYLIVNAFEVQPEPGPRSWVESEYISPSRPAFHRLDKATVRTSGIDASRNIYSLIVEEPLTDVPDSPEARGFLSVLEEVDGTAELTRSWKPETVEQWGKLLRILTTRQEIWLHGRVIRSSEVSDVLKEIYAASGYPTARNPIFPHIARGVLAVFDSDGRPLTSIDVVFDQERSDASVFRTVTFENVGSEPIHIVTEQESLAPIRLSGAPSLLYPAERASIRLKLEQSVFAIAKQESTVLVRYVSGGVELDAFEVRAHHSGWIHTASATLAATATLVSGALHDLGLPHMPIAVGLIISLLIIAVLRISPDVAAPKFAVRLPVERFRRRGRQTAHHVIKLVEQFTFKLDALRSIVSRFFDRASSGLIEPKNSTASAGHPSDVPRTALSPWDLAGWSLSVREAAARHLTFLKQTSSQGAALLWQASVRAATSLREASVKGMVPMRRASARRLTSLRRTSARRLTSLRSASARRLTSLPTASARRLRSLQRASGRAGALLWEASVRGVVFMRKASAKGVVFMREVTVRGVASLREFLGPRLISLRDALDRGRPKLQAGLIRLTDLVTKGAERMSTMLQHKHTQSMGRRSAVFIKGLYEQCERAWKRILVQGRRLRHNLHLYREFVPEPISPRDGAECVDRIRRLTRELRSKSTTSFSPAARRRMKRETALMARRLEGDLAHGKVPPTTANFQILWALRLLLEILQGPPQKMSASVHRWLDGADRVLRNGAHDGVGPTVPEFLSLVTPEYEIGA